MRALRDADEGLTLGECRSVLRPIVGRNRIEQALANIRQDTRVHESIERRENRAGRQERYLILRLQTGRR